MKCICGVNVVDLPSMNKRICFSCGKQYEWKLKPGQKSLLIKNLIGEQPTKNKNYTS